MQNRRGQLGSINVRVTNGGRRMARIRYWLDVPGQHARRRASTEWRDVTGMENAAIELWRTQVIAEAGVCNPRKPIPSEELFRDIADRWLDDNLDRYKVSCRDTVRLLVSKYLVPAFGEQAPESITGPVVNRWLGSVRLLDGTKPSARTLKHLVATLQVVLGRTFTRREVRYPTDARPKARIYCPSDEEIAKIVQAAQGVYRLLFAMAPSTGMRCGELYGLHIEDIDFERGAICVRQSFSRGQLQSPKTDRAWRMITVSPDLIEMIQAFKGDRTRGVLLMSQDGTPLHHPNVLNRQLHPILEKLKLPQFGMHSFRHYSVSFCVRAGMSFDDVRMRHGHGSEEIMRMYLHLAPGHDARTLRMIPNIVAQVGPTNGPTEVAPRLAVVAKAM